MKLIIDIPDEDYKFIKDLYFYNSGRRNGKMIERNVINTIKNGKPYEEKPQGEWLEESQGTKYPCECSECHTEPFCDDYGYVLSNFCPNCGADMRGGKQ